MLIYVRLSWSVRRRTALSPVSLWRLPDLLT